MKSGPEREYTPGAIGVEGRVALVPRARALGSPSRRIPRSMDAELSTSTF